MPVGLGTVIELTILTLGSLHCKYTYRRRQIHHI